MDTKLEHLVSRDLLIVGREVAGFDAVIFVAGGLPVCLDREVAAAAGRGPAEMAGEAGHLVGLVRQVFVEDAGAKGELASIGARFRHQLGPRRLHVEARVIAVDRSEEHKSELQSLMRSSYAVFCLQKRTRNQERD